MELCDGTVRRGLLRSTMGVELAGNLEIIVHIRCAYNEIALAHGGSGREDSGGTEACGDLVSLPLHRWFSAHEIRVIECA